MHFSARSPRDYRNPSFLPYPSNGPLKSTLGAANPDVYLSPASSFNSDGPTRPPASIRTAATANTDDFLSRHSAADFDFTMGALNGSPQRQYGDGDGGGGRLLRGAEEGLPHHPSSHFKSPRSDNDKNNQRQLVKEVGNATDAYFSSPHSPPATGDRVDWARSPNGDEHQHHHHTFNNNRRDGSRPSHDHRHYHQQQQQPYSSATERIAALLHVTESRRQRKQGNDHGHGLEEKEEGSNSVDQKMTDNSLSPAARSRPTTTTSNMRMKGWGEEEEEEDGLFRSPFRDAIAELSAIVSPRQVLNVQQHFSETSPKPHFATNTTPTRPALSPRGAERTSSGSRSSQAVVARGSLHHYSPSTREAKSRLALLPPPHLASLGALSPLSSPAPSQLHNAPNLDHLIRMNRVLLMGGADDADDHNGINTNLRLEDNVYVPRHPSFSASLGRASSRSLFEEPSSSFPSSSEVVALRERVRSLETHLKYSRGERKFFNHRGEALIPAASIFDSGIYKQFMNLNLMRRFYRKWLLHFRLLRRANTVPTAVARSVGVIPQDKGNVVQQRRDPLEVARFSSSEHVVPSNWAEASTRSRSPNASASIRWGASRAEQSGVAVSPSQQEKSRPQHVGISMRYSIPIRDGREGGHEDGEADSDLRAPLIVGSTRPPTPAPSVAMSSSVSYSVVNRAAHRNGEGGTVHLSPQSLSNRRVYADLGIPAHVVNYVQPPLTNAAPAAEGGESGLNSSTVRGYKSTNTSSHSDPNQQLQLVDQATADEIKFYNEIEALHSQVRALTLNAHEASFFVSEAFGYLAAEQQREGERLDTVEDAVEAISQRVAKVDGVLAGQRRVADALKRRQEETLVQMEAEKLASAKVYEEERRVLAQRSASLERQRTALEIDGTRQAVNKAGNIMGTLTRAYSVSPSQPTRSPSRSRSADFSFPYEVSSPSAALMNDDAKEMRKEQQSHGDDDDDGLTLGPKTDFSEKDKLGHSESNEDSHALPFDRRRTHTSPSGSSIRENGHESEPPFPSATTAIFLAPSIMRELLSQCESSEATVRGVLSQEATASLEMLTEFEKKMREIITIAFSVVRCERSSSSSPSPEPYSADYSHQQAAISDGSTPPESSGEGNRLGTVAATCEPPQATSYPQQSGVGAVAAETALQSVAAQLQPSVAHTDPAQATSQRERPGTARAGRAAFL